MRLHPPLLALPFTVAFGLGAQIIPTTINYQGRLTDNTPGQSPVNATVPMSFAIFNAASAGTQLWREPATGGTNVAVVNGIFNVVLGGNGVAIPPATFTSAGTTRYLEITLNPGTAGAEILAPRQVITATGYAYLAQNAGNAATVTNGVVTTGSYNNPAWITGLAAGKITGTLGTGNGGTGITAAPTAAGQYLRASGAGTWAVGTIQPADVPGGGGGGVTGQNFASVYLDTTQAVPAGTAILFTGTAALDGWTFTAATGTLTCNTTGTFLATFSVYTTTNNGELGISRNALTVTGTRARTQSNIYSTLTTIITAAPGDTIRLVNSGTSTVAINVNTVGQIGASLTLVRIQ